MKKRLDLAASLQLAALTVLFNLVLSYLFIFLIYGWLLPNFTVFSPALKNWYYSSDEQAIQQTVDICFPIGTLLSLIPSSFFAYRTLRARRKEFIKLTKGLISYEGGLRMHTVNYGFSDTVVFSVLSALLAVATVIVGVGPWLVVFPAAHTLFSLLGNPLGAIIGLPLLIALECIAIPIGALLAQKKWRALYFIGE